MAGLGPGPAAEADLSVDGGRDVGDPPEGDVVLLPSPLCHAAEAELRRDEGTLALGGHAALGLHPGEGLPLDRGEVH